MLLYISYLIYYYHHCSNPLCNLITNACSDGSTGSLWGHVQFIVLRYGEETPYLLTSGVSGISIVHSRPWLLGTPLENHQAKHLSNQMHKLDVIWSENLLPLYVPTCASHFKNTFAAGLQSAWDQDALGKSSLSIHPNGDKSAFWNRG